MTLYTDWRTLPQAVRGNAVALGNFDGVHRGHVHLLESLKMARPDCPPAVVTFEPHPRAFFRPQDPPFRLMRADMRAQALSEQGVDHVVQIPFDSTFSHSGPRDFVRDVLIGGLDVAHVACGADFAFGHRRTGDVVLLETLLRQHGVGVSIVPQLSDVSGPISSSRIRRLIQEGYPERAAELLGRTWSITGEVVQGDQRGRLLGFPTANIALGDYIEPARGVYAVQVRLPDGRDVPGVANVGRRPTINDGKESRLEAHLFDFDEDLYGQTLSVALVALLREEKRFKGLDELKAQIACDARQARACLERHSTC
ncbi:MULTISPECIES: bifunctional riboflavin kinase/FAD synthetase [unclassified Saccharibacter]|uniref:bifunctional riboflavin kinase/FAD synthetase n=1 Tax=unclassified Saccharibacter TaxID=2648722 RepID=UPI0013265C6E|nr:MULTISPECIES: bifunctional riboflavin kinase/FAD synthetase [unclassified Saccharibacter]MXV36547.1 bifunctional riboflavin kinase/FAD synthetase [Saccharibacter sp. EH611]MXV57709.1 bifunctional riboflavin kinase/FAD synthetase [Saccharibacter sp. EH70]MXV64984.1 bifunctional riboflavin kinase/FAD synthetase [Saccharibacter sp. EH60]